MAFVQCPVCGTARDVSLTRHLQALEGMLDETAHLIAEGEPSSDRIVRLRARYFNLRHHCDDLVRAIDED